MSSLIKAFLSSAHHVPLPVNCDQETPFPGPRYRATDVTPSPLKLHRVNNVEISAWDYGIIVRDGDGGVMEDLSFSIAHPPEKFPDPVFVRGRSAIINHWLSANYCHSMLESLPLIHALCEAGVLGDIQNVICDVWARSLTREVLSIYNSYATILPASSPVRLVFEELYVFEPLHHPAHNGHDLIGRFFDRVVSAAPKRDVDDRIMIVARPTGRRGFENLDQLVSRLGPSAVSIVSLDSSMTLLEQAALFNASTTIIAAHGAALANIAFCHSGARVIEIFNSRYATPAFWGLAGMKGIKYAALPDARGVFDYDETKKYDDILIGVDAVCSALRAR